ncbi:TetR/AcrR family transcriptional regulator [Mycolicibacterium thermoresistibile]|uniref:Transcriptional regulator TetR n=1 Tax=Mycolicibacterium thermoresistibile TaxID=1797 RepID=A0A100XHP5_MYCTH|nr:TetR/AcrR family transcriptional regulator [Mycolicibacterium thermoresistibile]GAT16752.1 transcriptional regulator TetR [Mycolicibacterium thermoresistibile]
MPRNNQTVPKAEREAAVLMRAVELFKAYGYRATSIAAVAKAAGLAPAAVHWYFPTKDDLFAAVLRHMIGETQRRIESDPDVAGDPYLELTTFLDLLAPYRSLHREAYERMDDSAALHAVYTETHDWLQERLMAVVSPELPADVDPAHVVDVANFFFEGLLVSVRRVDKPAAHYIDLVTSAVVGAAAARPRSGQQHPA